jgi:hypothetical protein
MRWMHTQSYFISHHNLLLFVLSNNTKNINSSLVKFIHVFFIINQSIRSHRLNKLSFVDPILTHCSLNIVPITFWFKLSSSSEILKYKISFPSESNLSFDFCWRIHALSFIFGWYVTLVSTFISYFPCCQSSSKVAPKEGVASGILELLTSNDLFFLSPTTNSQKVFPNIFLHFSYLKINSSLKS